MIWRLLQCSCLWVSLEGVRNARKTGNFALRAIRSETHGALGECSGAFQLSLPPSCFFEIQKGPRIWFGTRGSEVQILSPRPLFSNDLRTFSRQRKTPLRAALRAERFRPTVRMPS